MFNLIFWLSFFTIIFAAAATCPEHSIKWRSKCFLFVSDSAAFIPAEEDCVERGGHLASIHDKFTNMYLAQEAPRYITIANVTDFWIGATNMQGKSGKWSNALNVAGTDDTWSWTDGTSFDFSDWRDEKPPNTQSCGVLSFAHGIWIPDDCYRFKPYVCGFDATQTLSTTTTPGITAPYYTTTTTTAPVTTTVIADTTTTPPAITTTPSSTGNPTTETVTTPTTEQPITNSTLAPTENPTTTTTLPPLTWTPTPSMKPTTAPSSAPTVIPTEHPSPIPTNPPTSEIPLPTTNFLQNVSSTAIPSAIPSESPTTGPSTNSPTDQPPTHSSIPTIPSRAPPITLSTNAPSPPPPSNTPQSPTTTAAEYVCGPKNIFYNLEGQATCWFKTPEMDWFTAEQYCKDNGAHLASIHDDADIQFALSYAGPFDPSSPAAVWIGLHSNDNSTTWVWTWEWSDGTAVNFAPWDTASTTRISTCGNLADDGKFRNILSCFYHLTGVCKKDIPVE